MIFSTPSSASGCPGSGGGSSAGFAFLPFPFFFPAWSRSSCPSSPSGPSVSTTERKETSPCRISASPMGERQFTGGAMIFVFWMPAWSLAARSRSPAIWRGRSRSLSPAAERISLATWEETRLKEVWRNPFTSWLLESPAIVMSAPSSTPCGWGRISSASLGSSLVARGKESRDCLGRT